MTKKRFHKYLPTKGYDLYWILIAYLIIGYFYPVIGIIALICMIAPVAVAIKRGRWWCGNACPRGNMYDRLLAKYSPHRPIPKFVKTFGFRLFMVMFIFTMFGVQMYFAWGDINAIGRVFWNIILATTVVGVVLSFIYAPRTWCSFCPMGTLSSWVSPKKAPLPDGFVNIRVSDRCQMKCKSCAMVCPMQLTPYDCRGEETGYLDPDCIKCGKCVTACPIKVMALKHKK
ncbi:MAG: 4Fe-4S binding protein [Paramuribaculum sp.]|nr:4Fe-4S binding protein [Paramuribaculum sp.]